MDWCTGKKELDTIKIQKEGCKSMALLKDDCRKQEKMNGQIYDMSPSPGYKHGIINGNIYAAIKNRLKDSLCLVFMENLDFKYHPEENDDYVIPDVMIVCDRKYLKGGSYSGVPKFIVETLSQSTALRDRKDKMAVYEKAGVEEYWIVSPQGKSVEIYYLTEGKYELMYNYLLQEDEEDEEYNSKTVLSLREFPHITMKLEEIFEGME